MKESKQVSEFNAGDWQLEFVQLIAFPTISPMPIDQHWWQELVSDQPKDFVAATQAEFRDFRGTYQDKLLALTIHQDRIVWEMRSPRVVDQSGRFPTLGPVVETLDWFVKLLGPWLTQSCPPLVRLGLHTKLLQPTANARETYRLLREYLPGVDLLSSSPQDLSDFILQINRRKPSSDVVAGLPINRVSTWMKMNLAIPVEPGKPFEWPEECYGSVELDINTAPEKVEVLPSTSLGSLLRELASLAEEIVEHRDRP